MLWLLSIAGIANPGGLERMFAADAPNSSYSGFLRFSELKTENLFNMFATRHFINYHAKP